jgi:hypothetical protein
MDAVEVLDALAYHEKQVAYHQAQGLRILADYAIACEGEEFFDAEIAAGMRWTSRWTTDQIALALDLATKLPRTLGALEEGDIDLYKARVVHDKTVPLSADLAAEPICPPSGPPRATSASTTSPAACRLPPTRARWIRSAPTWWRICCSPPRTRPAR